MYTNIGQEMGKEADFSASPRSEIGEGFKCTRCLQTLPRDAFQVQASSKIGIRFPCKLCIREQRRGKHTRGRRGIPDPIKDAARNKVRAAVKSDKLIKPENCEHCGKPFEKHLLHGHHHDYSKPLDVKWLCASCHGLEEITFKLKAA